jgi:predicted HD superfamily hydrolase involved in NAD metabolism
MDFINNLELSQKQKEYIADLNEIVLHVFNPHQYKHTISTLSYCQKLAQIYILDKSPDLGTENIADSNNIYFKLCIAAMLHDYGKIFNLDVLREVALKNISHLNSTESDLEINSILHGFAGAFMAREEFDIKDDEILKSIKYHTVGYCDMSIADKIIYIADKIEEGRNYAEVLSLRELSLKNINLCLLEVYKNNIIYIIRSNKNIYSETFRIWNNICKFYGGLSNGPRR